MPWMDGCTTEYSIMTSTSHLLGLAEVGLRCDQEIERKYEIVPSVVCSMCCLFGIIYCFFGYRCFKAVLFLTGLMFGSVVIFMLCYKERVMDTQLSVEASVGIGLGIGTLCGLVTMLVRSVGLFMVGLLLGLLVAPKTPVCWFTWVILGVWPVLAFLGVLIQWKVTAEGFSHTEVVLSRQQRRVQLMRIRQREERLKKERENKKKKRRQNQKSSHKQKAHTHHHHQQQYHHPAASHPHHQAQSSQPPKVPPPQTEPGYHHKANPKRRFDGDVLSPSYIRSFRDRQTDRRAYSHSRMMSRARMAELDYDCGSQVLLRVKWRAGDNAYLRFVPVFSLCDVLGSDGLVLHADVPESSSQVGFGHVHLDLDLSVLHLALQLTDLLQVDKGMRKMTGRSSARLSLSTSTRARWLEMASICLLSSLISSSYSSATRPGPSRPLSFSISTVSAAFCCSRKRTFSM
ncbi:hypothetical protein INR49_005270 [Caranx melampygus]|nr:hypothetical protein INR49_005270 [Caranx melampygus]